MSTQPPPDGYGQGSPDWYGQGYPPVPPQQPPRRPRWPWVLGAVSLVAVVAVVALVVVLLRDRDSGSTEATATRAPGPAPATGATSAASGPAATTAVGADLPTNGILKVGTDIAPGEYAVRPTQSIGGYWERLSCLSGEFSCITANDIVEGDGYLTVLPSDVAVRIEGLELTRTGDAAPASPRSTSAPGSASAAGDSDGQGFVGVPQARCNATDPAVAVARTAKSLVVICQTGANRLYYKGMRLSDSSGIEIDDPVASGDGYTVTNNGVQYQLTPDALTITEGSAVLAEEPMVSYRTR